MVPDTVTHLPERDAWPDELHNDSANLVQTMRAVPYVIISAWATVGPRS